MVSKKRRDDLSDSDHADSDTDEETPTMSRSKRKRKATVKATVSSSSASPFPKIFWSKDDELVILKVIVDYQDKTEGNYLSDSDALFDSIKNEIDAIFNKDQLLRKIRKLKQRFQEHLAKKTCFTNPQDFEIFELSKKIWGVGEPECVDANMDKANGTKTRSKNKSKSKSKAFVEQEEVTNGNPEDDDELAKGNSCDNELTAENVEKNEIGRTESKEDEPKNDDGSAKGTSFHGKLPRENLEKRMENEASGKESEKELLALKDALETMMFESLSKHAQKLMLRKLRKLGATERKELSEEWKSLLLQETLLKCKKQYFSAKLGKAILDD